MKIRKAAPNEDLCEVCRITNHGKPCKTPRINFIDCWTGFAPKEYPDFTDEENEAKGGAK